jgi:hypothetical protein
LGNPKKKKQAKEEQAAVERSSSKEGNKCGTSIRKFEWHSRKQKEAVQPKVEIQRNPPNMVEGQP